MLFRPKVELMVHDVTVSKLVPKNMRRVSPLPILLFIYMVILQLCKQHHSESRC